MKTILGLVLSLTALTTSNASAGGWYCHAQCVAVTPFQVYVLKPADAVGACRYKNKKCKPTMIYKEMVDECEKFGRRFGLAATTVKKFDWSVNQTGSRSQTYSQSHHTTYQITNGYISYYNNSDSETFTQHHDANYGQSLTVNLEESTPENACDYDEDINENHLPYTGDLPIKG